MIKTIIFDLNKVLITYKKEDDLYKKLLGISRQDFWKDREEDFEKYTIGEIDFDSLIRAQVEKSGLAPESIKVAKKIHNVSLLIVPGTLELLDDLSNKFKLILMAGEGKESLEEKIKLGNLRKYFDKVYATCIQKIKKTNPEFYRIILNENNLKPEEVLFIDDREDYIEVAKSVGIKTLLFKDVVQIRKKLNEMFSP